VIHRCSGIVAVSARPGSELVKIPDLQRISPLPLRAALRPGNALLERCRSKRDRKRKNPNSVRSWGSFELSARHGGDGCA
jgi:hypothetical protein